MRETAKHSISWEAYLHPYLVPGGVFLLLPLAGAMRDFCHAGNHAPTSSVFHVMAKESMNLVWTRQNLNFAR